MYGSDLYSSKYFGISDVVSKANTNNIDLMKYLPYYYRTSKVMKSIQESNGIELAKVDFKLDDVLDQLLIDTATWGLVLWEIEYGLETDINKSYEERREILKAKRRGKGTVTKKMIKETAQAFSGGEVDIIEHPESYSFTVQFIGIKGIPRNLGAFKDMLDTIKPSHLAYDFKFTFTVYDFLKDKGLNWDGAKNKTWDNLKVYE